MKKLLRKLAIFTFIMVVFSVMLELLSINDKTKNTINVLTNTQGYNLDTTTSIERNINKVQEKIGYKYLLLGDSVASELFPELQNVNENICIATTIAGVGMVGQYVLLREFLENNPEAKEVYLVLRYSSICSTFDKKWGYQFAVMPLVHQGLINYLDDETINIIKDTYGKYSFSPKLVDLLYASNLNYRLYLNYIMLRQVEEYDGFDLGFCYLQKMIKLCDENDVEFYIYSDPVIDNEETRQKIDELKIKVDEYGLGDVFKEYFQVVKYYPEDRFRDGVHFAENVENRDDMNKIILEMYENTELLDVLEIE